MKRKETKDERSKRLRREAEKRRIFEDEGFTAEEIMFMPTKMRRTIMEKYRM